MSKSGAASLPLHGGKAPSWLFERMEELAGEIAAVLIREYGREELLDRLADPYWFQAFGCVLGFDWHSSGLTTTTMGALQEALDFQEHGITVLGGKGARSRQTPEQLEELDLPLSTVEQLQEQSRMSAQVDNNCLQDRYTLYHHTFVVEESGRWCVVQQGMDEEREEARRYHWLDDSVESYLADPQEAVCCDTERDPLNLAATDSEEVRQVSMDLVNDDPSHLRRYARSDGQQSLAAFTRDAPHLEMPDHHWIQRSDITERAITQLEKAYEIRPSSYEELVALDGIGKQSLRALALIAELVHGDRASWQDPVKYSYAHGGKDGTPYPVDREAYDESIQHMRQVLAATEIDGDERDQAFQRLEAFL
ncbi:MAG: DUF763 domain-containing protein [Candidatus Nanohaloarchaea archaeon]|nr:DUF763 domain-containing protein [Candidatus Nanohaloarchaea archaeon]